MKIMVFLLGTDTELALAEQFALFNTFSKKTDLVKRNGQIALFDTYETDFTNIAKRMALAHHILEYIGECPEDRIRDVINNSLNEIKMPFRVRFHNIGNKEERSIPEIEKSIAEIIWDRADELGIKPSVDMKKPKSAFEFYLVNDTVYFGKIIASRNKSDILSAEPQKRPFIRPTTMSSKTSRIIVNMLQLKTGRVLDPFCGTGAILIESAKLGFETYGLDIKEDLVRGAKENLRHFGLKADVRTGDARKLEEIYGQSSFDGVVSDLPYGISASLGKVERGRLYSESIASIERALKKGGFAVLAMPGVINIKTNMELLGIHKESLSTRLIRHIHVYRKV